MIDIRNFRENPDLLRTACRLKRVGVDVEAGMELDARRREIIHELESLQAERNRASKEIGARKKAGEDATEAVAAMKAVGEQVKALSSERSKVEQALNRIALQIPNLPAKDVPEGDGEEQNQVIETWGEKPEFDFEPKPHWELCEALGLADFARAAKLSGSGFILLKGLGARLERALVSYFLDLHTGEHGYTEWFPPFVVNRDCMRGTGQLPKMEDDMYHCGNDDLFLIPTAEVPVTNIHREEILEHEQLPLYYTAYSACFRREAGAAGKDTRGMIRVHQFNKVELVKFVSPEGSYEELESLRANAEAVLRNLGLHYRVVNLCTGDLSFASAKTYDLEVWAPGCGKFLEVSSCSNFEDFQARRASIRFRDQDGKTRFVHTLNGSGLALPRAFIAVIENNQQADGSIRIPECLRPYMGGMEVVG